MRWPVMTTRRFMSRLTAGLLALLPVGSWALEADEVEVLQETISKWVDTMQKITAEEARWSQAEVVLRANLQGLKSELTQIENQIAEVEKELSQADEASKEKLDLKADYESGRKALEEGLPPLELQALAAMKLFPEFFLRDTEKLGGYEVTLQKQQKSLSNPEEKGPSLNSRLAAVTSILTELERFNNARWSTSYAYEIGGKTFDLDIVYFGLGQAYAVDRGGEMGVVRTLSQNGWQNTEITDPEMVGRLRTLVDVAKGEGTTEVVSVPVTLSSTAP